MKMSTRTVRISAAALALAATLSIAPAADAAGLPAPLVEAWRRLVRLVADEGVGVDPSGFRVKAVSSTPAGTASALPPQAGIAAATSRPR
jgi:hypothetical protein